MRVASLYRYPIKGLSPQRETQVTLEAGRYFPGDRLFAIEDGPSGFDPAAPVHQPKTRFLMLMRHERLATLRSHHDPVTGEIEFAAPGAEALRVDPSTEAGRDRLAAFFTAFMPDDLRGQPRLLNAPDAFRFTDSRSGFVSLINLASVADLEGRIGVPVDPLRFRGNIMVEGLAPWAEFDLIGAELAAGSGLRLHVIKRIERCAATNVDPETGQRDLNIPKALQRGYGHVDCGIYCRVVASGPLCEGDSFTTSRVDGSANETGAPKDP